MGKSFLTLWLILLAVLAANTTAYEGSSFSHIRDVVFTDPYSRLPQYRIDKQLFGRSGDHADNRVLRAARRTLTVRDDLFDFPGERKLFQANGICFAGEWQIEGQSPYTGQFRQGTRTPVVVRASVALDGTKQRHKRAFAMAIKLFPDAEDRDTRVQTLNLFVMHSFAGVRVDHVLDLELDNAPDLGSLPSIWQLGTVLRLRGDLERADREVSPEGPDVTFRPVDHLAAHGATQVVSPTWVRLRAPDSLPRVDAADFRDELRTANYPHSRLIWAIETAQGKRGGKKDARWTPLGSLVLTESVVSPACDRRLHFAHPRLE